MKFKIAQLIQTGVLGIFFFGVSVGFITNYALASADVRHNSSFNPSFQVVTTTVTSTVATRMEPTLSYSFSLATLGYDEKTLTSPYDKVEYSFALPQNSVVQGGSSFNLDLSYLYNQADATEYPAVLGNITIAFDGETLRTFSLDQAKIDHYQLTVPLPAGLFANPDKTRHTIGVALDGGFLCRIWHEAKVIIHPTSVISLNYVDGPLVLDLAEYPRPFYQRSVTEERLLFTLPLSPTIADLGNALGVAAKLGDLTYNGLTISGTTDIELTQLVSSSSGAPDDNIIIIGQPQDNKALPLLNELVDLPVSLHQRQLKLVSQGPEIITPGQPFSYTFTVTNTIDQLVRLSLVDSFPYPVESVQCVPDCIKDNANHSLTWPAQSLAPNGSLRFLLTLKATDALTGTPQNTITLVEADLGPINGDTLTSEIALKNNTRVNSQVSVVEEGSYFFAYNGQATAREDGIIQEIVSPWNKNRAILIITGLSNNAVRKAAQALSSEPRIPGMNGAVALVRDTLLPPENIGKPEPSIERTLADLGYDDQVLQGTGTMKQVDYYFDVPFGWRLTKDAFIDLYFAHSQIINYEDSSLTVLINGEPISSVALNDDTATNGTIHIDLAKAGVSGGQSVRMSIEMYMTLTGQCVNPEQAWLLIKKSSKISLAHDKISGLPFNLALYPYPFHLDSTLNSVLFVMPDSFQTNDWRSILQLASSLGVAAGGKTILPSVTTGNTPPPEGWGNYNIIALGRPSRNSLIQEINTQLPQPFIPDTDEIQQQLEEVEFRLPQGASLGFLELIDSPWNADHALLAITGTTDQSVNQTGKVLTERPWDVGKGNLSFIRDNKIINTIDTRGLSLSGVALSVATVVASQNAGGITPATPIPTATVTLAPTHSPISTPTILVSEGQSERANAPTWLIFLVVGTILVIILIFVVAFQQTQRSSLKK